MLSAADDVERMEDDMLLNCSNSSHDTWTTEGDAASWPEVLP